MNWFCNVFILFNVCFQNFKTLFSKNCRPIGAPGSSRPRGRPPVSGGVTRTPVARQPSLNRSRNTRSNGAVDPNNYVGRRIWRWYPDEDPERPWVEGFLTDYDPTTNTYSILYDPNDPEKQEMVETGFDFSTTNPTEYVLGDIFDLKEQFGSSRLATRPEQVVIPPPTAITGPSKRRRSAPLKVPAGAPFPPTWFETAVLDAGQEDLQSMLTKLEIREAELKVAIEEVELECAMGEDGEKRRQLEAKFSELCQKEVKVMSELEALQLEQ